MIFLLITEINVILKKISSKIHIMGLSKVEPPIALNPDNSN